MPLKGPVNSAEGLLGLCEVRAHGFNFLLSRTIAMKASDVRIVIPGIVSGQCLLPGMAVDNVVKLERVSLYGIAPGPDNLGSGRLTVRWRVTVDGWLGNAAAGLSGGWGAVTRRAHETG